MTGTDGAALLQFTKDPLVLLELELVLPDRVSARMTREPSDATAASTPAPTSEDVSFDITFPHDVARPQATGTRQIRTAPFPVNGHGRSRCAMDHKSQDVTEFTFAAR